jgi:acetyl-CoA carboxylase biotin carboxyl carrier protein
MADETQPQDQDQNQVAPDLNAQVEYLRGLAKVVADEGLSELEVEADGVKWTLKTPALPTYAPTYAAPVSGEGYAPPLYAAPQAAPSAATPAAKSEEALTPIVSPMVGVFYRAPSPSDPNFVEVGDRVERGQTIGLVEAMKSFNEIVAESAGTVAKIPAETGQIVETGQTLILLK